jgi:hypothetical protein
MAQLKVVWLAAALLSLLPNVVELSLPLKWEGVDEEFSRNGPLNRSQMIYEIAKQANDESQPSAGLSRLESINPSAPGNTMMTGT